MIKDRFEETTTIFSNLKHPVNEALTIINEAIMDKKKLSIDETEAAKAYAEEVKKSSLDGYNKLLSMIDELSAAEQIEDVEVPNISSIFNDLLKKDTLD